MEHRDAGGDSTAEEGDFDDSSSGSDSQSAGKLLRSQTRALHSAPLMRFPCGARAPVPMALECPMRLRISHTQKPHGLALLGDACNASNQWQRAALSGGQHPERTNFSTLTDTATSDHGRAATLGLWRSHAAPAGAFRVDAICTGGSALGEHSHPSHHASQ